MFTIAAVNLSKLMVMFIVALTGGLYVKYRGVRVNYTRKINHFALFFIPSLFDKFFIVHDSPYTWIGELIFFLGSFAVFLKPVRSRIPIIATAFSSFDRPEDRPYTLLWYVMQEITGYLVVMPAITIYEKYNILALLSIPILVSVFGDGLAEPIGIKFGKHKYHVNALFVNRKYVRSIEGSSIVFISSILVVAFFHPFFTSIQYLIAMLVLPIAMTLAEAYSPHTFDNPLICFVGFTLVFLIKQFV